MSYHALYNLYVIFATTICQCHTMFYVNNNFDSVIYIIVQCLTMHTASAVRILCGIKMLPVVLSWWTLGC